MRIVIEQDMEGCAGILDWAYNLRNAGQLAWATRVMTDEVNAAVEGALQAGAAEVVVLEAHPFDHERLHPKAQVSARPLTAIREPFDLLFFVGRHAMSGVADGVLNHTGSSRSIRAVRVNGRPFGELGLIAAWFGAQGVPTGLVAGDEAACREAREFFGEVETAAVKRGAGCHEAVSLSAEAAQRTIRIGAERAVRRREAFHPFVVAGPVTLEMEYTHSRVADWICRVPGLERVNAWTTRLVLPSFDEAFAWYYAQGAMLYRFDAY